MHLAFRMQSEEFLLVTRIKLRDVLRPLLFLHTEFRRRGGFLFFSLKTRQEKRAEAPWLPEWKTVGARKRGISFQEISRAIKKKIRLYLIHKKIFIAPAGEGDEIFW